MKKRILMIALLSFAAFYALDGKLPASGILPLDLPAIAAAAESTATETPQAVVKALPEDPDERAVLTFLRGRHTGLARHDEANVARAVVREAHRHQLDPALVLAVIQVESGGFNFATSHVGALGLMQLLPATAEELAHRLELDWRGPDSLFDPVMNVKLGTAYIKHLADRYGEVSTALAAYNWGPGRIDRRIRKGSSVPSVYIERVMKAFDVALSRRQPPPTAG